MPLPLPDLDSRRYVDLADEARASIPRLAARWTDHNASDPGITLIELVAAELDRVLYAVNRITDRDRLAMLRLLGFPPLPPAASTGVAAFSLTGPAAPLTLPAGLALVARDGAGAPVPLTLRDAVRVGTARLAAVQSGAEGSLADRTRALATGEAVPALGPDPAAGRSPALYLGFDPPPEAGVELSLRLALDGAVATEIGAPATGTSFAWEWYDGSSWQPVASSDDTSAGFGGDGGVRILIADVPPPAAVGAVATPLSWLRCRLTAGVPDAAPMLNGLAIHAGVVEQAAGVISRLRLDPTLATPSGEDPIAGTEAPLALDVDAVGVVTAMAANAGFPSPPVEILERTPGSLLARLVVVGLGLRTPHQTLTLPGAPVLAGTVSAWIARPVSAGLATEPIRLLPSLDACGPHDTVAVLDASSGTLIVGDGRRGRMLAPDELVLATFERTLAAAGNLRAASPCRLNLDPDGPNPALLSATPGSVDALLAVALPWPLAGGLDAEEIGQAAGRASRRLYAHERLLELIPAGAPSTLDGLDPVLVAGCEPPERALTGADLERITLGVPGRRVVRARAFPELDAALPGLRAAGTATVVVLPSLPAARPLPSDSLLAAVRAHLEPRRIVGTRLVVAGPTYVDVIVRARLALVSGAAAADAIDAARAALDAYLHPLTGGRDGRGWPFGRDVYRADILAVLDGAKGVASVISLDLAGTDGMPTCGNLCVPATALVAAGVHVLEAAS